MIGCYLGAPIRTSPHGGPPSGTSTPISSSTDAFRVPLNRGKFRRKGLAHVPRRLSRVILGA
eukprot:11421616-Alexandrium_andersonii.AAC.1